MAEPSGPSALVKPELGLQRAHAHLEKCKARFERQRGIVARLSPLAESSEVDGIASNGPSLSEELERLAALHGAGALSDDEFQAAKARLIEPE